jgi:hypothetical protein
MARETRLLLWLPLTPPDAGRSCDGCGEEGVAYTVGKYARRTSPQALTLACDLSQALDNDHCLPPAVCRTCAEEYGPDARDDLQQWLAAYRAATVTREEALRRLGAAPPAADPFADLEFLRALDEVVAGRWLEVAPRSPEVAPNRPRPPRVARGRPRIELGRPQGG